MTQNTLQQVQGIVERMTQNGARRALKVNDEWYSTFNGITDEVQEGDSVKLAYASVEKNGRTFHNIKGLEITEQAPEPAPAASANGAPTATSQADREQRITRSVALKAAVENRGPGAEPAEVLAVTELFAAYLNQQPEQPEPSPAQPMENTDAELARLRDELARIEAKQAVTV